MINQEEIQIQTINHLGEGIEAQHLNDDKIGRVMDKLYLKGLSNLFLLIALAVVKKYHISTDFSHLDSSSFALQGKYEREITDRKIEKEKDKASEKLRQLMKQEFISSEGAMEIANQYENKTVT